MNYQEMSDEEIDLAVSEIVFGKTLGRRANYTFDKAGFVFTGSGHSFTPLDNENVVFKPKIKPTSSWADAGQIAHQYKINLYFSNNENMAEHRQTGKESITCTDYNPCRAICIVFLMMKGGE